MKPKRAAPDGFDLIIHKAGGDGTYQQKWSNGALLHLEKGLKWVFIPTGTTK